MKKIVFIAIALFATLNTTNIMAQEENGFKAVNLKTDFKDNAFEFFTRGPILASGDTTSYNAMTIGWGAMGNYLGYDRQTIIVYVAPSRYTHSFMEKYPRFTVMEFDDPKIAQFMGTKSGRDLDKAKALGLHVAYTKHGTPYFLEAKSVIECEIMSTFHQSEKDFRNNTPKQLYGTTLTAGVHTVYIGEVLGTWIKE